MDAGGRRRREQATEDARSRDGQEVLYAARGHAYSTQAVESSLKQAAEVAERRLEQAAEDARSRPDAALPSASMQARPRRARCEPTLLQEVP